MNTCFFVISDQGCNMFSESYPKREDMFLTTYALNQFTGVDCVNWEWSCW
jgi:DNA relaxase NicK